MKNSSRRQSETVTCCALCGRGVPLTFHHLIPRTLHSNKWFKKNFTREQMGEGIYVCRDCHGAIHRFIPDHKKLGRHHNTLETLLEHEGLAGFVAWLSKRDPASRIRTSRPRPV